MTGEDVKKTGGSFLIERWPDPGRGVGAAVGSAHRVGPAATSAPIAEGRSAQRPASGRVPARRAQDRLGREDESVRRRQRPHGVRQRGHSVRARLALHRSLLPHELRHAGQDERAGDAQRRRGRRRRRRGCSRRRPSRRRSPWPISWRRPAARAWRSRSAKARIWRPPTRTRAPHVCEKTRSSRPGSSGTRKRSRRSRGWWSAKRRRRFGRSSSSWPRRSTAP